ncbi:MAG: HAD family phosphatase [Oscillospiraceae bacterium]|nr:HAD family phosphatase [Oscillospiraceae bacterium]
MIRGVAFDMDGLMFDTERLGLEAWEHVGRAQGFQMPRALWVSVFGMNGEDIRKTILSRLGENFDYDGHWKSIIAYINRQVESGGTPMKPGLKELLDYLKRNGYRFALASSTPRYRVEYYLKHAGVLDDFKTIVCGDMVRHGKPEPDIYLEATYQMGLQPEECMALEDAPRGILSAYRAGLRPVMIPDLIEPDEQTLSLLYKKLSTLHEVIPLLEADRMERS